MTNAQAALIAAATGADRYEYPNVVLDAADTYLAWLNYQEQEGATDE